MTCSRCIGKPHTMEVKTCKRCEKTSDKDRRTLMYCRACSKELNVCLSCGEKMEYTDEKVTVFARSYVTVVTWAKQLSRNEKLRASVEKLKSMETDRYFATRNNILIAYSKSYEALSVYITNNKFRGISVDRKSYF